MALNGWHLGERLAHQKLGHDNDYNVMNMYQRIDGDLPGDHAIFHSTKLPFVPIVTLDSDGRPWGSLLAGKDGKPGFIKTSRHSVLSVDAKVWPGEPLIENAKNFREQEPMLVAGIGIEFPTRRRNKFAGQVSKLERNNDSFQLDLTVNEAIGNCPKYINARDLVPHPDTSPKISAQKLNLSQDDRLPESIISFIQESDTVFLGTTYQAPSHEARRFPSHVGMNQRGGRKGFIRVVPSDGRTIVLPDFSGNRIMTSLGNIEATPLASLTFVSFTTGDILYITGDATNLYGSAARTLMPFQNTLTTVYTTGYTFILSALPVRQRPTTPTQPSPYSPPIRLLAVEAPAAAAGLFPTPHTAHLTRIALHSASLATFTWEASADITVAPGQAAILDFTPLLGAERYQHMAPARPAAVNDDRVRTWTVSRTSGQRTFALTMREKPGGVVTGALFAIARKLAQARPALLEDARELQLEVGLVGIAGEFVLSPPLQDPTPARLLWVAGGIGVTPFLAMIRGLGAGAYDVQLVLATREPEVLLPLLREALLERDALLLSLSVDVFCEGEVPDLDVAGVTLRRHTGRISVTAFEKLEMTGGALNTRAVYVCGPQPFESVTFDSLVALGVERKNIRKEGFAY